MSPGRNRSLLRRRHPINRPSFCWIREEPSSCHWCSQASSSATIEIPQRTGRAARGKRQLWFVYIHPPIVVVDCEQAYGRKLQRRSRAYPHSVPNATQVAENSRLRSFLTATKCSATTRTGPGALATRDRAHCSAPRRRWDRPLAPKSSRPAVAAHAHCHGNLHRVARQREHAHQSAQ